MVCPRCIMAVTEVAKNLQLPYSNVQLGEINFTKNIEKVQKEFFETKLIELGFEVIDKQKSRIIEQIKKLIIEKIHYSKEDLNIKWSDYISSSLAYDYKHLSSLFTSVEGLSLEQYIIRQKVEKIKELIIYEESNLSEISYLLGYSSVAHLSNQFKKVTGMSPSEFKKQLQVQRKSIDSI